MTQANRRTVVGSNPRGRDASRPFFVCEADGVDGVVGAVLEALGTRSNELIVISGLPGVGKSATARFIASDPRFAGVGTVLIDAHNRSLTVGEIVDELGSALGVPGPERIGMTTSHSHVLDGGRYRSTLLVVDGVDSQGSEVMELFFALAEKMHVLVTTRSSSRLRSLSSNLWEVEHGGLSMVEMRALMDHVVNRDPLLKAKFERSDPSSIEAFLAASNGWPEALLINIGLLQRTTGSVVDIQTDITRNVYDVLLGGMYAGLQSDERRCLRATVYFPSSFTVDGLRRVGHISRGRAEAAVTNLVRCHLVEELPVGNFSWAHPTIRDFVLRTAAPREPSSQHDRAKRYLEEYVRENGGQPRNDWGNFRRLDLEFTNLRSVMERLLDSSQLDKLTELVKDLFSYIVERGHWAYMDSMCRRVLASDLESHDRANWLIWHSWINLYLLEAPAASASLAEEAATMATGDDSLLFEARRRALLAFAKQGNAEKVEQCLEDVAGLARGFPADGDEIMDAENSSGRAILAVYGSDSGQVHRARDHFRRARKAGEAQRAVNSREVAEAILGEAKCAGAIASDSEALRQAESALTQTLAIGWLRGQVEANGLVAAIAKNLGDEARSTAAERDAENVRALIRELGGADGAG